MEHATDLPVLPKWLQDLEENSWNLELLISGSAIFSLIQATDWLVDTNYSLLISVGSMTLWRLGGLLNVVLNLLTVGFAIHLVMRGLWVAALCVSVLYPAGARAERVRWRFPFRVTVPPSPGAHAFLLQLNRVCAAVMFVALIASVLLGGLVLMLTIVLLLPVLNFIRPEPTPWLERYVNTGWWLTLLYVLDLALFGLLRRLPVVAWLVFPVFWLFDRLSLRVFYQPLLWVFATNVRRLRFAVLMGALVVLGLTIMVTRLAGKRLPLDDERKLLWDGPPQTTAHYWHYLDELGEGKPEFFAIPSALANQSGLRVFAVYRAAYDFTLRRAKVKHLTNLLTVRIDDSVYQHVTWVRTSGKDRDGFTTVVPIRHLPDGFHTLHVRVNLPASTDSLLQKQATTDIPFWKVTE